MSRFKLLSLQEVAEELDITVRQVKRLIWDHKLPVYKPTGVTGAAKVSRADLDAYLTAIRTEARS